MVSDKGWKDEETASLPRLPLHIEITARVRVKIQQGELKPGSRIPELMLCREFEISRTPLREALKVLAAEGLVILQPHKGSLVAPLDPKELTACFEVMNALLGLIGELACRRGEPADFEACAAATQRIGRAARRADQHGSLVAAQDFHQALATGTKNGMLLAAYWQCLGRAFRAAHVSAWDDGFLVLMDREHQTLFERLQARDGQALAAALLAWNKTLEDRLLELLVAPSTPEAGPRF